MDVSESGLAIEDITVTGYIVGSNRVHLCLDLTGVLLTGFDERWSVLLAAML